MGKMNDFMRIVRRPSLLIYVARGWRDRHLIERSEWFDEQWYVRENGGDTSGLPPALHYSITGFHPDVQPSPDFVPSEYFELNPDSKGCNPLAHYEKRGKAQGRPVSCLQASRGGSPRHVSLDEHQAAFPEKARQVREKVRRGGRVRSVFLVYSASMFPARPLFSAMARDPVFEPVLAAIPDTRLRGENALDGMRKCREALVREFGEPSVLDLSPDDEGRWPDILADADIAVYSTPYALSNFRYNPHWSVGRGFLPIHVDYSFWMNHFGKWVMQLHNMGYFWKAYLENDTMLDDYREASRIGGSNGVVVGYMKMDALPSVPEPPRNRKAVLIAPHHSVPKGMNDRFQVSNFLRFSDYFLTLPERHPDLDFVFRPHPYLFKALSLPTLWGRRRVRDYVERLRNLPHMELSEEADNLVDFARTDAIVQDCGSFLPEYFYTGKPCCYMLADRESIPKNFNAFGEDCIRHCYQAFEEKDIEAFLDNVVVRGNDPMKPEREAFRKTVMVNYPHAAEAALKDIKKSIGID